MILWDEKPANVSTIIPYWFDKCRWCPKKWVLSTEPLQESLQSRQYWMDLTIPWKLSWRCQPRWMMFIRVIRGIYNYNDRILKNDGDNINHSGFSWGISCFNQHHSSHVVHGDSKESSPCKKIWVIPDPNELLLNRIYVDIDGTWCSRWWSKRN